VRFFTGVKAACIVDSEIVPAFFIAATNPVVPLTVGPKPIEPTV